MNSQISNYVGKRKLQQLLKSKRSSGILLHITSLPGPYGIGEIGKEARLFIDNLADMGQQYWQILPTNNPETCNSPYDTNSAFAQNPFLISLEGLIIDGLLKKEDLDPIPNFKTKIIEYKKLKDWKSSILSKAAANFLNKAENLLLDKYNNFCSDNDFWLNNYALFMVIKEMQNNQKWSDWEEKYKFLNLEALSKVSEKYISEIEEIKVLQFLFHKQWEELKSYAAGKDIKIIGDIPIYISFNSADVWTNQSLFKLDEECQMLFQSGCPPDHFMASGQLWGHPIYDWKKHEETGFRWWSNRIRHLMKYVDVIRVDHFNGFAKYWEVSAGDSNAVKGKWVKAKGLELLEKVFKENHNLVLIAEDLGEAAEDAKLIRDKFDIPGMDVLQYVFYNEELPNQFKKNTVLYTGTHDNDTLNGWYNTLANEISKSHKNNISKFLDLENKDLHWSMIEYSLQSKAMMVMIPVQDLLGLGSESRMNTPGTISDQNWSWRMEPDLLKDLLINKMKLITKEAKR